MFPVAPVIPLRTARRCPAIHGTTTSSCSRLLICHNTNRIHALSGSLRARGWVEKKCAILTSADIIRAREPVSSAAYYSTRSPRASRLTCGSWDAIFGNQARPGRIRTRACALRPPAVMGCTSAQSAAQRLRTQKLRVRSDRYCGRSLARVRCKSLWSIPPDRYRHHAQSLRRAMHKPTPIRMPQRV